MSHVSPTSLSHRPGRSGAEAGATTGSGRASSAGSLQAPEGEAEAPNSQQYKSHRPCGYSGAVAEDGPPRRGDLGDTPGFLLPSRGLAPPPPALWGLLFILPPAQVNVLSSARQTLTPG